MPLLIGAVWVALFLAWADGTRPIREAALAALTAVWIAALGSVWLLSLFTALTPLWLAAWWLVLLGGALILLRGRIGLGAARLRRLLADERLDAGDRLFALVLALFAGGTLLSAVLYPIVNFDSLTCHATRVFFWFQNRSIAPYPTSFGPQLFEGPLGAYMVLSLKVLAGGSDRFANLVQWTSYLFAVAAASLLAMRLGASRRGQQITALVAATIPMAVLQASTTQNDLNVAVWSLIAVYCGVTLTEARERIGSTRLWVVWTGSALGLALLAKPTAYMFCFPFFVWVAVTLVRREGWRRTVALASGTLLVALLVNSAWYVGNARLLGGLDVIGVSAPGVPQAVSRARDPRSILVTALKNGSMEVGTPVQAVNERLSSATAALVRAVGGEVEDQRTKETPSETYRLDPRITNHDVAPSPLTVLLAVLAGVVVLGVKGSPRQARWYLLCAAVAGFTVAGLISWNHYINRLLLGSLLLFTPVVGVAASLLLARGGRLLRGLLAVAIALSVGLAALVLAFNSTNRLVPPSYAPFSVGQRDLGYWNTSRDDLRFRVLTPDLEAPYKAIASAIAEAGVTRVGLDVRIENGWFPIYPLLSLLSDRQVGYVRDTLFPEKIPARDFAPEVIVEIVPADRYPQVLSDGRPRGAALLPPQRSVDHVLLLYRAP